MMNNPVLAVNLSLTNVNFNHKRHCDLLLENIMKPFRKLPKRIAFSFLPPLDCNQHCLYRDFLGPFLSTLILISLLNFGFHCKTAQYPNISSPNTILIVFLYYGATSIFIVMASLIVNVRLKVTHVLTLIGYSFYGVIFTLLIPFALRSTHEYVFYGSLVTFGGLSCFRVLLIIVLSLDVPVARFLICSLIGNLYVLFVIYLYYCYIHPTYNLAAA